MIERDLEGWTLAFDLDGTLVETHQDLVGTLNRMLVSKGLPPAPMEGARDLIGGGARALLEHGFTLAGAPLEQARNPDLFDAFIADYIEHIADESAPFDGVVETLETLSARGATLVVVTNKRSDLSELLLGKIDLTRHFAAIVGPDRVSERKPSGAHLIEAIKSVGGDPARAVMVGDAAPDAGTAKDANIPCVLVSFGYTPIPVEDLGGDIIVDAFEDVEEAVDMIVVDHYVNKAMFGG
ncbi:HAD-IA family hydrolase [Brevundimonas subvibrioides]|uniref:Phosphoglycolate phosphatase n=1 Tax=Brevundimonas subvibrioides (strain ATCC 15264 / DSM 4735 / LMG 14903 / NBRC 16000 / CB 81) TaxID=633149 RepID=D9QGR2_BRESC|nr:HAD-IA family hydrolase [Brevundimonas subvibrioides]ADL00878.1 HAD-superfamily hydrolase, subfamily IA, variant 3 [Brevundimonas subvibrioides ATCC 15264]